MNRKYHPLTGQSFKGGFSMWHFVRTKPVDLKNKFVIRRKVADFYKPATFFLYNFFPSISGFVAYFNAVSRLIRPCLYRASRLLSMEIISSLAAE